MAHSAGWVSMIGGVVIVGVTGMLTVLVTIGCVVFGGATGLVVDGRVVRVVLGLALVSTLSGGDTLIG